MVVFLFFDFADSLNDRLSAPSASGNGLRAGHQRMSGSTARLSVPRGRMKAPGSLTQNSERMQYRATARWPKLTPTNPQAPMRLACLYLSLLARKKSSANLHHRATIVGNLCLPQQPPVRHRLLVREHKVKCTGPFYPRGKHETGRNSTETKFRNR
jgi:hypothetical protein